jgi:hypothetical protein
VMTFALKRVHHLGDTVDWPTDVGDIAQGVRDAWNADIEPSRFGGLVSGNHVGVYHLGTDGRTIDKGVSAFEGGSAWVGSGPGATLPWETSIAVTLYGFDPVAFTPYASRKRGRFYLPPMSTNMCSGGAGALDLTNMDALLAQFQSFIQDVNGILLHDYSEVDRDGVEVGVLSRKGGIFSPVTHLAIDNRFDVQRRRQNRQSPTRHFATI